jgi:hypothetical protein
MAGLKSEMTQLLTDEDVLTDARFGQSTNSDSGLAGAIDAARLREAIASVAGERAPRDGAGEREQRRGESRPEASVVSEQSGQQVGSQGMPLAARSAGELATRGTTNDAQAVSNLSQATLSRIQDRSLELQARGGGLAKVQIRDAILGEVNLRVAMNGRREMTIEIVAADERVRKEIEKGIDDLRSSLEKGSLTVSEVKVTSEAKSTGDSDARGRDDGRQNSPQGGSTQQQGSGSDAHHRGRPEAGEWAWAGNAARRDAFGKKIPAGNNPAADLRQRIVERGENGSLKVFA